MSPGSRIRRFSRWRLIGCPLLALLAVWTVWRAHVIGAPRILLEVAPDTTLNDARVQPNGRVDYAAWLNEHTEPGVTPDNNAATVLLEILPRDEYRLPGRDRALRLLKLDPAGVDGPTFLTSYAYLRQKDADRQREEGFHKQAKQARERPWTESEFPEVAAWLELNHTVLDRVADASSRDRFWMPRLVQHDGTLRDFSSPVGVDILWEAAQGLPQRSMRRLAAGDVTGAWNDLLACHRLGRLVLQSPGAWWLSAGLENNAHAGERVFLRAAGLPAAACRRCLGDLEQLPPRDDVARHVDTFDRFVTLDYVLWLATRPAAEIPWGTGGGLVIGGGKMFDVNVALREVNRTYDSLVEALRVEDPIQRRCAVADVHVPWNPLGSDSPAADGGWGEAARILLLSSRAGIARRVSDSILRDARSMVESYRIVDDRLRAEHVVVRTAFALVAFHADHRRWPEQLGELRGDDLADVPADPCSDGPLHYRRTPTGYLIYSVGPNGMDEGGAADPRNDPAGPDDISVMLGG